MNLFKMWQLPRNKFLKKTRHRLLFTYVCFCLFFGFIVCKLCQIMIVTTVFTNSHISSKSIINKHPDIKDRNGELLATNIPTQSCYADPSVIIDMQYTLDKLSNFQCMPSKKQIQYKLRDKKKHFVWLARHVHPKIQNEIMDLGLPGIHFQKDYKRIYIYGNLFSHVIGFTDIDGNGICGLEKRFDKCDKDIVLSLDLKLQNILREELVTAIERYKAIGGYAILMKTNGEILAMVSLPDFDPGDLKHSQINNMFNKNTLGVFEHGSILKILTAAIALDSKLANLGSVFDASTPIKVGRFSISDFKGKYRPLTLAESIVFSSNIGCAKIAQQFGTRIQREYFKKFGLLDKIFLEIPEVGAPIVPKQWTEITTMTIAYGYGLAMSPIQLLTTITSLINGGIKINPTLLLNAKKSNETRLISKSTSAILRDLMRGVVMYGTAKKADIDGFEIFGKTGTAYKIKNGKRGYGSNANRDRLTTFVGGFPKSKPKYMLLVSLDNPQGTKETYNYATAGWNAAPTAKNIFNRILPILDIDQVETSEELQITKYLNLK